MACANRREHRSFSQQDETRLQSFAARYAGLVQSGQTGGLLQLGRDMWDWLDGSGHWLSELSDGTGPRELEFGTDETTEPPAAAQRFLNAPWELLAPAQPPGFLAADAERPLVLSRRLGQPGDARPALHADLLLMFMAASPPGTQELDYEREEVGILRATARLPLHLRVEESGCLEFLSPRLANEGGADALHLSCHGDIKNNEPVLILESPRGDPAPASSAQLTKALGQKKPPLLFLSACRTAEQPETATSLSLRLIRSGVANVIGWDGSVFDCDASDFAHAFYRELTNATAPYAAAIARGELLRALENDPDHRRGRHWHLARIYLGSAGGGAICDPAKPKRPRAKTGDTEFLDKERAQVPVASAETFVGRRRDAQTILREFASGKHAGVLIHGMGRLGKSSLAARIANRMSAHRTVVIFGDYRAEDIWSRVMTAMPPQAQAALRQVWSPQVESDPAALELALQYVLEGTASAADAARGLRPLLLIIDDLEQILEPPRPGQTNTPGKPLYLTPLRAVLRAFANATTESRLLLTSRYQFTLPDHNGADLAQRLFDRPLAQMNEREQDKQLRAVLELRSLDTQAEPEDETEAELLARAVAAGRGNPGLQTRLTSGVFTDRTIAGQAIAAVERFHASGDLPREGDIGEFFEQLKLGVYCKPSAPRKQSWSASPNCSNSRFLAPSSLRPVPPPAFQNHSNCSIACLA
jgi:hypothetical protein